MTKKDYIAIAEIIREAKKEQDTQHMIQYIESAFQCLLACDNPRFDIAVKSYLQTDPRGAALYIIRPDDIPEGKDVSAYYSRGLCVC
jgi:hypothetical protein